MIQGVTQEIFNGRQLLSDPLEPSGQEIFLVQLSTEQLPEGVPDAAAHPLVVYAVVAAAVAYVLAMAVAKAADPISSVLTKRREYKQASEDARIIDLSHQVDHLAGRVYTLEARQIKQDQYLFVHAAWDQRLLELAIQSGIDLDDIGQPPPLRPPMDAP